MIPNVVPNINNNSPMLLPEKIPRLLPATSEIHATKTLRARHASELDDGPDGNYDSTLSTLRFNMGILFARSLVTCKNRELLNYP